MEVIEVDVYNDVTRELFQDHIYKKDVPAVIRGTSIGDCTQKWDQDYLKSQLGEIPIKIHVSNQPILNFIDKNFTYQTASFGEFMRRCESKDNVVEDGLESSQHEYLYLRSIGTDKRGREIANIFSHFPSIASDINIPSFLPVTKEGIFSSVFRISSAHLVLWTHYDIMDNILVQVKGTKRVVLFSPDDVQYLYLKGDKSKVIDIHDLEKIKQEYPLFLKAKRYSCVLKEGDMLFIPSLWFHSVHSLTFSIGINFFWKDQEIDEKNWYDKTDVYGNKDLTPACNAIANLDKAFKHLSQLPIKFEKFYLQILKHKCLERIEKIS